MAKTLAEATKRPANIGERVPNPPQIPPPAVTVREQPGLAIAAAGPAPALWTTSYDSVKQFYRPGTSQQRFPPLPTKANPQINAQTTTIITKAIANIPTPPPPPPPVVVEPTLPLPNSGVYFQARAIVGATSLQTIGDSSTSSQTFGTGSEANGTLPTATDGVNVQVTTGATNNSGAGFVPANHAIFWAGRNCIYQARYRFPTSGDISAAQVWTGFSDQTPSNLRPPISGSVNIVAILCDFGVWKGIIYNAGVLTSVVLTGTPDTNTHSFAVVMNDTANTTTFFIDGAAVGSISGNNPTGLGFWPTFTLLNATAGASTANNNLEYFYAQQDF